MTNKGLEFTVPSSDLPMIRLHCSKRRADGDFTVSIKLRHFESQIWHRVHSNKVYLIDENDVDIASWRSSEMETIYIPQEDYDEYEIAQEDYDYYDHLFQWFVEALFTLEALPH